MRRSLSPGTLCLLILLVLASLPTISRAADPAGVSRTAFLFSTVITVTIHGMQADSAEILLDNVFHWMRSFEEHYAPGRENRLAVLNRRAAEAPVALDPDSLAMLQTAAEAWQRSGGLYDVSVGPLSECYGFKTETPALPGEADWQAARTRTGFLQLGFDPARATLHFARPGMQLDLGGLAKGYAIDRVAEMLRRGGVKSALIEGGGDILALGQRGERPFRIGIADPDHPARILARLDLADGEAVATSGDYERFFIADGIRYCHIFDPRTGRPGRVNRAATVVAASAQLAETLSLSAFLMTAENALTYVEQAGGAALIVDAEGRIHRSPGMEARSQMNPRIDRRDRIFFVLVGLFLLLSVVLAGRLRQGNATHAEVTFDGRTVQRIDLSQPGIYELTGALGPVRIEVGRQGLCILDTPCPDRICQRQGYASRAGETIVCVPGRLVILLCGPRDGERPDAVTR